jgi:DNA-binding XRE family transcriptional regulator
LALSYDAKFVIACAALDHMARKWQELKQRMSPAARRRVDARVKETLAAMPLAEVRRAVGLTQEELASRLDVGQGSVSKLENAADMYLTTLRKYVEALGGELRLIAEFPEGRRMEIERVGDVGGE